MGGSAAGNSKQRVKKATDVRVPAPGADDLLTGSRPQLNEDDPAVHRNLQAVTREGDPSMTLVLLYKERWAAVS
ncbi:MAG: hypothetical protein R3C20_24555 [Planctomycetaceae bacterium]